NEDAVAELSKEYKENGEPITDDSSNLHKFSYKLEYLLQFDQKEKTTFLGTRKDYWDYFSDCLSKIKGANDGIRFVKSIPELKTSLGKGRAFIRYSLVHQRLADTLQQCVMNEKVTSDWYYARSPFLKPHLNVDIINHLYELNEIQFDVASRGHDLDAAWPTFARRTLGPTSSPAHMWKPPSRSSSINSLISSYSQAHDFPSSPDFNHTLMNEPTSAVDDLRIELDQSELKQQELQERVQQLERERQELLKAIEDLQKQLEAALSTQNTVHDLQECLKMLERNSDEKQKELEIVNKEYTTQLQSLTQELESFRLKESSASDLQAKLSSAEQKNMELLAKLNGVLNEKGQQTASYYDSAQKMHELLDKLNKAEKEKIEVLKESEEGKKRIEKLTEELKQKEASMGEREVKASSVSAKTGEEKSKAVKQAEELKNALDKLQGALTVKEKESSNLQMQLQDLQEQKYGSAKERLERQLHTLTEQLKAKEKDLSSSNKNVQHLKEQVEKLLNEEEVLNNTIAELNRNLKEQSTDLEDYKTECTSLKAENEKLLQTVKRTKDTIKELTETRAVLEDELAHLRASEKQLKSQIDDAVVTVDDKEKKLRDEIRHLDENYQKAVMQNEAYQETKKKLEVENEELKQEQANLKEELSSLQAEIRSMKHNVSELEKNVATVQKNEKSLKEQLQTKCSLLEEKEQLCNELLGKVETCENKVKEAEKEKANAESCCAQQSKLIESITTEKASVEKVQLEQKANQTKDMQEMKSKLLMAESQLELNMKEVSRLQSEVLDLRTKIHSVNEELEHIKNQLKAEQDKVSVLETDVSELKALNSEYTTKLDEKTEEIAKSELVFEENGAELQGLKDKLIRTEEELAVAQKGSQELRETLDKAMTEKQSNDLKVTAELDDLYRTKKNLEERLIELIRDKDALWQKSDALEFEQKLRAEERWLVDREVNHCPDCQSQFTWWLRRHHCRLCGRIFCYYCSNHFVMTKHSGKKERCCKECYMQHRAVVERFPGADMTSPQGTPSGSPMPPGQAPRRRPTPSVTVTDAVPKPDDVVFDIITEEELNGVHDSESVRESPDSTGETGQRGTTEINTSTGETTPDEPDELMPTVQDAEIYLLKSGELTLNVPLTIEEITQFGDGSRELFIKSSCYSVIPIAVKEAGPTISWVFSSEPKSISFSVVYKESPDSLLEQAKVLIPLTRCNSHKETIQGQLKVRNPGIYMLIFDNSFSRFISKKVLYHLTIEKPIIYDGSDFL
ncbi:FYCO1 protein, partial [Amia calva]|nr:FYCO1 protein [Amia calva]